MGLRDDKDMVIHNHQGTNTEALPGELSDTWCKLLGIHPTEMQANTNMAAVSSSLNNDPWRELLQAPGVEIMDLQHLHLDEVKVALSELEVEEALQIIQEHPSEGKKEGEWFA